MSLTFPYQETLLLVKRIAASYKNCTTKAAIPFYNTYQNHFYSRIPFG